jgi:hypothetical protein
MGRANHHCSLLSNPSIGDLMPICLPQAQPQTPDLLTDLLVDYKPNSIFLKSKNLNFQHLNFGIYGYNLNGYNTTVAGLMLHMSLPFSHVVKFDGRYYLHNGFHRAYGAAKAGATHMPCFIREVTTAEDVGIKPEVLAPWNPWMTFPLRLLQSSDPPTVGHFSRGYAHAVKLRSVSHTLQVAWSETVMPDEYDRMKP